MPCYCSKWPNVVIDAKETVLKGLQHWASPAQYAHRHHLLWFSIILLSIWITKLNIAAFVPWKQLKYYKLRRQQLYRILCASRWFTCAYTHVYTSFISAIWRKHWHGVNILLWGWMAPLKLALCKGLLRYNCNFMYVWSLIHFIAAP